MTDADLVRQTRNGHTSAYEVLVRRWSARLTAYVRSRVGNSEAAEDIAQDALLKAYRSLNSLAEPAKFGSWLLSIAHRASIDWLKAKSRGEVQLGDMDIRAREDRPGNWQTEELEPADLCIRKEQRSTLFEAIESLPEALREVLMLYYYEDVTYKELADVLGVSAATINARLTKARHMLREKVTDPRTLS